MIRFKTFPWADIDFVEMDTIEAETPDEPRLYKTPKGLLPSATSILSTLDDGGVDKWRERVGQEEADRITNEASDRGNAFHDYNELYLQNNLNRSDLSGSARTLFNRVKKYLDQIELVVATEVPLYSVEHRYAGRVDCIGMCDDKIMIIDHKNSRRPIDLSKDWNKKKVVKYCIQTCLYSIALFEMKGIKATHGMLIVGNHLTSTSNRFVFDIEPLIDEAELAVEAYHAGVEPKESAYFSIPKLDRLLQDIKMTVD